MLLTVPPAAAVLAVRLLHCMSAVAVPPVWNAEYIVAAPVLTGPHGLLVALVVHVTVDTAQIERSMTEMTAGVETEPPLLIQDDIEVDEALMLLALPQPVGYVVRHQVELAQAAAE